VSAAVHGLPKCDLETRWSNCAVRRRKQSDMGFSQPYEISNDGTEVYKNNSRLRRFAGIVVQDLCEEQSRLRDPSKISRIGY
jgi:hypothetical protein